MALNLGDINFGLGVDTRRLSQSVSDVVKFGNAVDAAAKKTGEGARRAEADLRRQEKAALAALQQTLKFNESIRKAGAPERFLADTTKSMNDFIKSMTRGRLSALEFQRAQEKLQADMGRTSRAFEQFKSSSEPAHDNVQKFTVAIRNLQSSVVLALGPLSGIGARIAALSSITNRSNLQMAAFAAGMAAGGVALSTLGQAAVRTAIQMDQLEARFIAVSETQADAAASFEMVRELSDRAGTELISTANAYARLTAASRGTALEGQNLESIFEDMIIGASKFQLTQDEMVGTFRAFEQMMSKGTVQAEELRGQLGDRLVGAFNIAADAMGMTTAELNKALKAGEVMAEDFLPKFAEEFRRAMGADQTDRVESLRASMNRLQNAQTEFNIVFDETFGISQLFEAGLIALTNTILFFKDNLDGLVVAAAAVGGALAALHGPAVIRGFIALAGMIKTATIAMIGLNTAIAASPAGGLAVILSRIGVAALGATVGMGLASAALADTGNSFGAVVQRTEDYLRSQEDARRSASETTATLRREAEEQLNSLKAQLEALTPSIPQNLSFEADDRGSIERFFDELPTNLSMTLGMGDPATKAWLEQQAAIAGVQGQIDALTPKLEELQRLEAEQLAIEQRRAAVQARILSEAEMSADQTITRVLAEADAMQTGQGALQALKAEFQQADAIERFREALQRAEVEMEQIDIYTTRYVNALKEMQAAQQAVALDQASEDISRLREELQAMGEGSQAVETLKRSFEIADQVDSFRQNLVAAGIETSIIAEKTREYEAALIALDGAMADQRASDAIAQVTAEIERMTAEAAAIEQGEEAFRRFQEQAGQTQQIEQFRAALQAAGVEAGIVESIINSLTGALFRLSMAAGQARIDAAISDAADATARVRAEAEALASGPDAFQAFQNAQTVEDSVRGMEDALRSAGVAEEEITTRVNDHRAAMEGLVSARDAYDAALKANRGGSGGGRGGSAADEEAKAAERLVEETEKLVALQQQLASENPYGLITDNVNLLGDSLENVNSMLSSLLTKGQMLSNIELGDLRMGFDAASELGQYRAVLEGLGLSTEEVNLQLDAFKTRLLDVSNQEAALKQIADIYTNIQDTIASGWDSVGDAMAEALVQGKFDLSTLADIGAQVATELLANFLKLAVIKPLLNSIFGGFGASFGQLFTGGGGFSLGGLFSRKGNAFSDGSVQNVRYARKGALLTGPTAFSMDDGLTIGGEAGTEAIMPLARTSSGDLGIIAAGGGGGNTINFNFPVGTDVKSFQKSESQLAAMAARVASRGSRNQ